MSLLSEDDSRLRDFRLAGDVSGGDAFKLEILERSRNSDRVESLIATNVAALEQWDQQHYNNVCDLRIILAPLDIALLQSREEFLRLFEYLGVPSAFVSERLQSVRYSFGGRRDSYGLKTTWFHFLCRRPNVQEYQRLQINSHQSIIKDDGHPLSLWDRFGMFMRVSPNRDSNITTTDSQRPGLCITLFGAGEDLENRLRTILDRDSWMEIMEDPYILIDVILDELYLLMDRNVQEVSGLFGSIESKVINSTQTPGQAASEINFRILHNISKDVIYLEESFDSIIKTAESVSQYHDAVIAKGGTKISFDVTDGLEYRKSILISSRLQVRSLQKRVQNLIDLSFHLVTQNESHIFQQDSFSMHALALVSLLFVPLASVSSFLGTPFFKVSESSTVILTRGPKGIIWGVSGATLVVFVLWLGWYWSARIKLKKGAWEIRTRVRALFTKDEGG